MTKLQIALIEMYKFQTENNCLTKMVVLYVCVFDNLFDGILQLII